MDKRDSNLAPGPDQADVARRLGAIFAAIELSPAQVAEACGCGENAISQWLGRGTPRLINLTAAVRLCSAYAVTLDYIYRGEFGGMAYDLVQRIRTCEAQLLRRTDKVAQTTRSPKAKSVA